MYKLEQAPPTEAASPQVDVTTGGIASPADLGDRCGCEPGLPCMSHAIARMSAGAQAALQAGILSGSPEPWSQYVAQRQRRR